ncbi:GNAT family N-acetyltransferase [Streptomyces sp. NPDC015345]|uniref:GNAT family N-acetyltransferase n=1 Tax=Streptomyces sp. NPDC015345 TaxID=3364953 RepID=UPI0037023396
MPQVRVREMTDADCASVAEIRVLGWRNAYAGLMPQAFLDGLDVAENEQELRERLAEGRAGTVDLIAERGGRTVGWACFGPARDNDVPPDEAELYALYAHPEHYSTGIGRALLLECMVRCKTAGHPRLRLWVVEGNTRARRFYERFNFTPDGAITPQPPEDTPTPELRYTHALT